MHKIILNVPFKELSVSDEFLFVMEFNKLSCLAELIKVNALGIIDLPLSGYRILKELFTILDQHALGHLKYNLQ